VQLAVQLLARRFASLPDQPRLRYITVGMLIQWSWDSDSPPALMGPLPNAVGIALFIAADIVLGIWCRSGQRRLEIPGTVTH